MKQQNEIISHNIRLLRKMQRLNQQEFGEKYGADQKSMSVYERGAFKPKNEFLLAMSKHVGISPDILLSTKLKASRDGKIINLPSADKEIQEIRIKLKEIKSNFQNAILTFFDEIDLLNERLDQLQKRKK